MGSSSTAAATYYLTSTPPNIPTVQIKKRDQPKLAAPAVPLLDLPPTPLPTPIQLKLPSTLLAVRGEGGIGGLYPDLTSAGGDLLDLLL